MSLYYLSIYLTCEIFVGYQFILYLVGEYLEMLGQVGVLRYAAVSSNVVTEGAGLEQRRKEAWIVEQSDLIAAECIARVLRDPPLGELGETEAVFVALEGGHIPDDLERFFVRYLRLGRTQGLELRVELIRIEVILETLEPVGGKIPDRVYYID